MRRKQLYIDDDLDQMLKEIAEATGRSEADHVRQALRTYLADRESQSAKDPLAGLVGLVENDKAPPDLARELDHYAYGVPKGHKRSR